MQPGHALEDERGTVWSKMKPVRAASWWANTTTWRGASAPRPRPTTFQSATAAGGAEPALAPAHQILRHPRRRDAPTRRPRPAPAQHAAPPAASPRVQQPQRPEVRPVDELLLDADPFGALLAQPLRDPVGRLALAGRARQAVDRGQVLDRRPQALRRQARSSTSELTKRWERAVAGRPLAPRPRRRPAATWSAPARG